MAVKNDNQTIALLFKLTTDGDDKVHGAMALQLVRAPSLN